MVESSFVGIFWGRDDREVKMVVVLRSLVLRMRRLLRLTGKVSKSGRERWERGEGRINAGRGIKT